MKTYYRPKQFRNAANRYANDPAVLRNILLTAAGEIEDLEYRHRQQKKETENVIKKLREVLEVLGDYQPSRAEEI